MALDLTPDQKAQGRKNFETAAADLSRRGFMKSMVAGAAVVPVSAAVYFGYQSWKDNKPVRTALIGCGDEGGVLIGDHNPEFNEFVAVCDVRPYNLDRIYAGEPSGPRKGLNKIYGKQSAAKIAKYDDYKKMLADATKLGIEAVVVATPLILHHQMVKDCMDAGLHVLCEKLMARTIGQCKDMIAMSKGKNEKKQQLLLSVGHQRHYSTLYAHAREVVDSGILGDIKHIRALWHRNNSWRYNSASEKLPIADGPTGDADWVPYYRDGWCKPILKMDADKLTPELVKAAGFEDIKQLVRWRLFDKTGGGLMAELGSHQLDASSIFLGNVHPLAVSGVGGKFFYGPGRNDRESDDGVFVTYEFPGPNHPKGSRKGKDESDIVVVTYSSFNTNSFEQYGECLMGSRGTMVVERESDVMLYREPEPGKPTSGGKDTLVTISTGGGGKPAMEATSTWGAGGAAAGAVVKQAGAAEWDTPVRGYRTEMEHFAYCVRKWDKGIGWEKKDGKYVQDTPRCDGEVAMADAILALTANMAMDAGAKTRVPKRIVFEDNWFKPESDEVPETKYGPKTTG